MWMPYSNERVVSSGRRPSSSLIRSDSEVQRAAVASLVAEVRCSLWKGLLPRHRRLRREVPLQSREDVLLTDSHDRRMRDAAFNGNRIKRLLDIRNDANPMDRKAASDRAFDRDRDGEKSKPRLA